MKKIQLAALMSIVAVCLSASATQKVNPNGPYDLSHTVPVRLGHAALLPGDSIVIEAIHGSADTMKAHNIYKIDGHYTLTTQPRALLAVDVTSAETGKHATIPNSSTVVDHGDGTFSVYLYMWNEGDPHISFYYADKPGSSFACVYFDATNQWGNDKS